MFLAERKRTRATSQARFILHHKEEASNIGFTPLYSDVPSAQTQDVYGQQNISNSKTTLEQRIARRDRDRARRQSLTPEERERINARRRARRYNLTPVEREEINARRRAQSQNLTAKEREEINARRRARRQSMTLEQRNARQRERRQCLTHEDKLRMNARRREHRQSLTPEERQELNARQRARRQSLPPEERRALLDRRNADYAARRDTPCKESIALQCPNGSLVEHPSTRSYNFSWRSSAPQPFASTQGNSHVCSFISSRGERMLK